MLLFAPINRTGQPPSLPSVTSKQPKELKWIRRHDYRIRSRCPNAAS